MWNIAAGHPPQLPTSDQLSELGIDFLRKCFERDPRSRPSAAELLQHDWVLYIAAFGNNENSTANMFERACGRADPQYPQSGD